MYSLVLLARSLNFIRFVDASVEHFVRQFAVKSHLEEVEEDWNSFELGNSDIVETLFLVDVIDNILGFPSENQAFNHFNQAWS